MKSKHHQHKHLSVKNGKIGPLKRSELFRNLIGTSSHMFERLIWDTLLEYIFENFEFVRV